MSLSIQTDAYLPFHDLVHPVLSKESWLKFYLSIFFQRINRKPFLWSRDNTETALDSLAQLSPFCCSSFLEKHKWKKHNKSGPSCHLFVLKILLFFAGQLNASVVDAQNSLSANRSLPTFCISVALLEKSELYMKDCTNMWLKCSSAQKRINCHSSML